MPHGPRSEPVGLSWAPAAARQRIASLLEASEEDRLRLQHHYRERLAMTDAKMKEVGRSCFPDPKSVLPWPAQQAVFLVCRCHGRARRIYGM